MSFPEPTWKAPENRQALGFPAVGQDFKSPVGSVALVFQVGSGCAFFGGGGNDLILIACSFASQRCLRVAQAGILDGN